MTFAPSIHEWINRARSDLRMGIPLVLCDGPRALLICAVESLSPRRLADLRALSGVVMAVTARRAETLKLSVYDGDLARFAVPTEVPLSWLASVANPAKDLNAPLKGPFRVARGTDPALYRLGLQLVKSAELLPAIVAVDLKPSPRYPRAADFSLTHSLSLLELAPSLLALQSSQVLQNIVAARLPMRLAKVGRLHVFRKPDGGQEHYAIEIGKPARDKPLLTRIHSACFTGDVLGSLKCDCGPQLHAALHAMGQAGEGVLVYLNQEGRGIGLANKMRAYALQEQGFDTVEANHRLGFEDDERDFRLGASILLQMGFGALRLMTNNPQKINMMQAQGIRVIERVPLHVGATVENAAYLAAKRDKSGHME
ncbi:MAG: GTP cyclohydrolase II [Paracoccaceae bacterium]|jgi:GTP cyclohydrolase II